MPKVIVITGASDGIGAELARQWAVHAGTEARFVLAARSQDKLEAVAQAIEASGAQALVLPTDVTDREACRRLIEQSIQHFGRIDVLVNNAGMSAQANFEDLNDQDLDWYQDLMTLNYWSAVWLTMDALPHLRAGGGQILAVSSVAGLAGVPGRTAYCGTKWAMNGFFEALRAEVAGDDISVTLAYPGVVSTAIREVGYGAGGQALGTSGIKEDKAMSVERCAQIMLEGTLAQKRDIVFTSQTLIARWLKLIAPGLVDKIAMNEVKPEFRPKSTSQ